ncbi:MAG: hypothetical protein IPL61_28270 [Myxococcales bacterium]|nr:hypothetical protein [Myxococcales bacterium]
MEDPSHASIDRARGARGVARALRVLAVLAALTAAAVAQVSVEAETAFRDGKRLMTARRYAQACAAFAASDRIEPSIAAKMKLADCEEQRGRLASAWGGFLQVAALTRDDLKRQPEHQVATARALALEPRLPYLTISVPEASRVEGLEIVRNGAAVDPGVWNRAVPVDRGTHTVVARAPGHRAWSTTVVIEDESEQRAVDVPRFEVMGGAAGANGEGASTGVEGAPSPARERSVVVPGVLAATAVALGGVGLGLELSARGRYDDARASTDARARDELYDSAVVRRRLAVGAGVAAIATAGAAGWLWWRGRRARGRRWRRWRRW